MTVRRNVHASPCEWCGKPIEHERRSGRRRAYCSQAHRQRAYEVRAAARRQERDIAVGRIDVEPGERVVEIVHEPRWPTDADGWASALKELRRQLRGGLINDARMTEIAYQAYMVIEAVPPAQRPRLRTNNPMRYTSPPDPIEPSPTDQVGRRAVSAPAKSESKPSPKSGKNRKKRGKKRRR